MLTQSTTWHDFSKASLHQVRRLKELEPVLYDRKYCRHPYLEMPVYEIYRDCCNNEAKRLLLKHNLRYDLTVMPPLLLGEEYVKTIGHHHLPDGDAGCHPEVLHVLEGEARFLLQRYQSEELIDVSLIVAQSGDTVLIPPGCGHVMINASSGRLTVENIVSRSCVQTYKGFIDRKGAAYFLLKGDKLIGNKNCPFLPGVRLVKCGTIDFVKESTLAASFLRNPETFRFLSEPARYDDVVTRTYSPMAEKTDVDTPMITVIVPAHNEEGTIGETLKRLNSLREKTRMEIVVVDDGSTDDTLNIVNQFSSVKVVRHNEKQGKGSSIRTGLAKSKGEVLVIQDADLEYLPEEIPAIVQPIVGKQVDVVFGSRFLGKHDGMRFSHFVGNKILSFATRLFYGVPVTDLMTGHKAFSREAIESIELTANDFEFEAEITAKLLNSRCRYKEVPISYSRRQKGNSKIGYRHGLTTMMRLLRERL
jgi:oxalate decarboxylase/phosphoglucose isomerase-like protein (cupin superfamily)